AIDEMRVLNPACGGVGSHNSATAMQIWLSPDVLNWICDGVSGDATDTAVRQRPLDMVMHADSRLAGDPDEFARADAITTLKRAVIQRTKVLNDIYRFRAIPIKDKPKDQLELMEWCGLIRSTMLTKLLELRNRLEHQ